MARQRNAAIQRTLLDLLIRVCELTPVRRLANRVVLNRAAATRAEVIDAVAGAVAEHYREHKLEAGLAARQARTYQKVYFRQRVRDFRHRVEAEPDHSQAERWRDLASYFREASRHLGACQDSAAVISHLARYYAEDMAADLNPAFFGAFKQVAKRLFPRSVTAIHVSESQPGNIDRVRELDGRAPVIYVPNHVSNADHIPICFALNSQQLRQPRIAAGANLFRGASTLILPRVNAYKIRREHIGSGSSWLNNIRWFQNPIYRLTHTQYLRHGWHRNESLMFYIEGTRSRDGTIGKPKLGILGDALAYARDSGRTLHAVPVSIAYTVVPEDRDIEASRRGDNISHKDLVAQLTTLDRSYRTYTEVPIHVRLGAPIPVTPETKDVASVGAELMDWIKRDVVLTDTSVAAACALAVARKDADGATSDVAELLHHWAEQYGNEPEFRDRPLPAVAENAMRTLALRQFVVSDQSCREIRLLDEPLLRQYANRLRSVIGDR